MVAGGFAIGLGMNGSGLADAAIESIPFRNWSPICHPCCVWLDLLLPL